MYTTCLFCHADLGRNEAVEAFPVGRRLAYDAAKGRLWVVCRKCERWNLTPLESRWEAIEQAERLFRDIRLRAQTDNVGMARLRDGTELVRVGAPLRPEFAAWRYGDQFGRRRTRQIAIVVGGVAALGAVVAGGLAAGVGIGGLIVQGVGGIIHGRADAVVARLPTSAGVIAVKRKHLGATALLPSTEGPFAVRIVRGRDKASGPDSVRLEGEDAARAAALLLPAANRFGGSRLDVREAVTHIETAGGPEALVESAGGGTLAAASRVAARPASRWMSDGTEWRKTGLMAVGKVTRLALEMALHEEQERRAMAGDLAPLERAWREAEEIAAIADDLLFPDGVGAKLGALKARRDAPLGPQDG